VETEDPRQRNREACTGGKLQGGGWKRMEYRILHWRTFGIEQGISNDEGWVETEDRRQKTDEEELFN